MKGSFGPWCVTRAVSGALNAIATIKAITTIPAKANLSWRNRRQKSCQGLRPTTCALGSPGAASGASPGPAIGSLATCANGSLSPRTAGQTGY
jgi:hypothetical protein